MIRKPLLSLSLGSWLTLSVAALAQMPVIDAATLTQATQTAQNTAQIMNTNQQILNTVNQTLGGGHGQSLHGRALFDRPRRLLALERAEPQLAAWRRLPLHGRTGILWVARVFDHQRPQSRQDAHRSKLSDRHDRSCLHGSGQHLRRHHRCGVGRSGRLKQRDRRASAGRRARSALRPTSKGSIDQNSQIQTQTGQTINELIGTVNLTNASLNAQQQQDLAAQSKLSNMWTFNASKATLVWK